MKPSLGVVAILAVVVGMTGTARADVRSLSVDDPVGDLPPSAIPLSARVDITHLDASYDPTSGTVTMSVTLAAKPAGIGSLPGDPYAWYGVFIGGAESLIDPGHCGAVGGPSATFGIENSSGGSADLPAGRSLAFPTVVSPDGTNISFSFSNPVLVNLDFTCLNLWTFEGVYPKSSNASRQDDSINDAFFNGFPNTPTANPRVTVKIVKRHATMRVRHWSLARGLSVTIGGLADDTGTLIVTIAGSGTRHHYHHTYRAHSKLGEYTIARPPALRPGLYRITLTYTGDPHRYPITLTHTAHIGTR